MNISTTDLEVILQQIYENNIDSKKRVEIGKGIYKYITFWMFFFRSDLQTETFLTSLKEKIQTWEQLQTYFSSKNVYVLFFAVSVVENWSRFHWIERSKADREVLKPFLWNFLLSNHKVTNLFQTIQVQSSPNKKKNDPESSSVRDQQIMPSNHWNRQDRMARWISQLFRKHFWYN